MPGPVYERGDAVDLHVLAEDDHEFVSEHLADPRVRPWFGIHEPQSADEVATHLEDDDSVYFVVCADGEPVGVVWLFRIRDVSDRAELGYWIAPAHQRQGYATEAAELAVEYAFRERGCNRVQARVYEGNEGSRRVLESLGFQREGRLREHVFADGEYRDVTLFGLLASEW